MIIYWVISKDGTLCADYVEPRFGQAIKGLLKPGFQGIRPTGVLVFINELADQYLCYGPDANKAVIRARTEDYFNHCLYGLFAPESDIRISLLSNRNKYAETFPLEITLQDIGEFRI